MAYEPLQERSALRYMLPWLEEHVEQTEELMGDSKWWKDRFAENKHAIDKFLDYHFKQGGDSRRRRYMHPMAPWRLRDLIQKIKL